jgi:large subunit ribosomal protein L3
MAIGLVGKKSGMTRVFTEDGRSVPVTVIEVLPNRITQIKTLETDGYIAVQMTAGEVRQSRVNKPAAGHFAKAKTLAGDSLREYRVDVIPDSAVAGATMNVSIFAAGQMVDVQGVSKGRGYAGTVRRWNFRTQDASHGNSVSHRAPGSIGQCQTPGRVFKGKKMSGHMGNVNITVQNLEVVRVDAERNLILIKGAVPGPVGGDVRITPAVKAGAAKGGAA